MIVISGKEIRIRKVNEESKKYNKVLLIIKGKSKDLYGIDKSVEVLNFSSSNTMFNKISTDGYYVDFFKQFDIVIFHMYSNMYELDKYKDIESKIGKEIIVSIQDNEAVKVFEL